MAARVCRLYLTLDESDSLYVRVQMYTHFIVNVYYKVSTDNPLILPIFRFFDFLVGNDL